MTDRAHDPLADPRTAELSNAEPTLLAQLTAIWEELFGRTGIHSNDDFFELGGDSLTAVTLMLLVRERFGKALPLATLFDAGTPAKLAKLIEGQEKVSAWSPLVAIRAGGTRTPLFCIHPGGGNVLGYSEFISHLDPDLPVYGLQAYGVVEGQEPHTSIPQMARAYLEKIREVQPQGPYYVGGESIGGLVAYELACQVVASGERVALLFLGDVWTLNVATFRRWRYILTYLTYIPTVSWAEWRELFVRKILGRRQTSAYVKRYTYADALHRRNSVAHTQAAQSFVPGRFPGKVTLFRAQKFGHQARRLQQYFGGPEMCWPALAADGVELHWMPDEHREMMHGPNAYGFARVLQDCIDRAAIRGHKSSPTDYATVTGSIT